MDVLSSPLISNILEGMYFMTFPSGQVVGIYEQSQKIPHVAHLPWQIQTYRSLSRAQDARTAIQGAVARLGESDLVEYLFAIGMRPQASRPRLPKLTKMRSGSNATPNGFEFKLAIHQVVRVGIRTKVVAD